MQKKIQDLAYARFYNEKPVLKPSFEPLEFEVFPGEVYQGSFVLSSENEVPLHGSVCSSHSRITCLTTEFSGRSNTIFFEFRSNGLREGDISKGALTVISDGGERSLPFTVRIVPRTIASTGGNIRNLDDFARLAQSSYEEAYRIYTAEIFEAVLEKATDRERLLYRALGGARAPRSSMEEFLVGTGRKEPVTFSLEERELSFGKALEDDRQMIPVQKDGWGYLELTVNSDSQAFVPVKKRLTSADFVGNHGEVEFIIRRDRLHGGKNFGRIMLEGLHQHELCQICIQDKEEGTRERRSLKKHNLLLQLARLYLDFRLQRIVTGVWAGKSCDCLLRLRELEPENQWYVLYQAQTLLVNKQRQEADWLLSSFRREKVEKDSPLFAYYLYLTTLKEQEPSYVARALRQIREIYQRNQENLWLFLILLFLDSQLSRSSSRKLSAIREKVSEGMHSPILYLEAYQLYKKDVYLLQKADDFELRVLNWAAREHALVPELVRQMVKCMGEVRSGHPLWYRVLQESYQVEPGPEVLQAVVSCCIRWNLITPRQFVWFDRGIQEGLNIAGLYEAWMESASPAQVAEFPRPVMIYFQYQSNLDERKRALLYASILKARHSQKSLYEAYQKKAEQFAIEQIKAGNMDESLAVIYREILENLVMDEEMSQALSGILYTCKVTVPDAHAVRLVAVHQELEQEYATVLVNGQTYLPVYTENYWIVAEDQDGTRYLPGVGASSGQSSSNRKPSIQVQRLLQPEQYVKACIRAMEHNRYHLLHYYTEMADSTALSARDMPYLRYLMGQQEINKSFQDKWSSGMIDFYENSQEEEGVQEFLEHVDWNDQSSRSRERLMELFTVHGLWDRAYDMMMELGCEQIPVSRMMMTAGEKLAASAEQEEEQLRWLCTAIFCRGTYNEGVLAYLIRCFKGSLKELERLWKAAREFELDTYPLEERFLSQLLYTEEQTEEMEEIFASFYQARGREMLLMAFMSYASNLYFAKNVPVKDKVFSCIFHQISLWNPLNDVCRLACLKWLTLKKDRTEDEEQLLEQLLGESLRQGKAFAFYSELPERLKLKYHLHDRSYLEYRTGPGTQVMLRYRIREVGTQEPATILESEERKRELMEEMYPGIFVKELVLFYGEEVSYSIWEGQEEAGAMESRASGVSGVIEWSVSGTAGSRTRYGQINEMLESRQQREEANLGRLRGAYEYKQRQAQEQFGLL